MSFEYWDVMLLCLLPSAALIADALYRRHQRNQRRNRRTGLRSPDPRAVHDNWAGRKPPGLKPEGLRWMQ